MQQGARVIIVTCRLIASYCVLRLVLRTYNNALQCNFPQTWRRRWPRKRRPGQKKRSANQAKVRTMQQSARAVVVISYCVTLPVFSGSTSHLSTYLHSCRRPRHTTANVQLVVRRDWPF